MLSQLPPPPPQLRLPAVQPEPQSDLGSESDDYAPSEKKQKVNDEEDGESSDFERLGPLPITGDEEDEEGLEEGGDAGYFEPNDPGDKLGDIDCWVRYLRDIRESEGFDFREYPGSGPLTSVFPMQGYLRHPEGGAMLKDYASKALSEYNEKHDTKYEVKDILKLNGKGGQDYCFFLTLTVKNGDGEEEFFQIKVVSHMNGTLDFPIVRPRLRKVWT